MPFAVNVMLKLFNIETPSTVSRRNFKAAFHSENASNVPCSHYTREEFENANTGHFVFVLEENSGTKIT